MEDRSILTKTFSFEKPPTHKKERKRKGQSLSKFNASKNASEDLEMGQIFFGNPVGEYACDESIQALIDYIFKELERVYWNINQREFDERLGTGMEKLIVRSYYWGEDEKERAKPNFSFDGVEIRWYKHRERGQTVNVKMSTEEWIKWFKKCLKYIRSFEKEI